MARWPAAVLALVLAFSGEAWAGAPTETLTAVVTTVNRLLDDPRLREKPEDLQAAIRAVVADRFEARLASRLVLGRWWDVRTPEEREEFVQLFKELVEGAYISRIAARATVRPGLTVRYLREVIEDDQATVTAMIESRDGTEVPVEHRMIRRGDRWMVYDVSIEGVDLVQNYRAQFQRVLRRSSYPELVAELKAKVSTPATVASVATEPPAPRATARVESGPAPVILEPAIIAPVIERGVAGPAPRTDVVVMPAPRTDLALRTGPELRAPVPPLPVAQPAPASFWIQMGAFTNQAAGELASRLLEESLPLAIDAVKAPTGLRGQLLLRVRIGPFTDRAEAAAKLRDLQAHGYKPIIATDRD
jgi:phospholipid transport system substrate-binding protein